MNQISLYEQVNLNRLNEVFQCDIEEGDDEDWFEKFKVQLVKYASLPNTKKGKKIVYKQVNNYGRFYASIGLQGFQRDVRKYLCGEFVKDIDVNNCHPNLMEQLLVKKKIAPGNLLRSYNSDRNAFMKKYKLKSKLDFIQMINHDTLQNDNLQETHSLIYTHLLPILKAENKPLFARIKKTKMREKKFNYDGAFISHYLQNIENNILMSMKKFVSERGFVISTLCFDGFTICNDENLTEQLLLDIEAKVFEDTQYEIKLSYKSMDTDWVPIRKDVELECEVVYPENLSR